MTMYDADTGPPVAEWLATAGADRIRGLEAYHRRQRIKLPRPTLHVAIHVVVESQIAIGEDVTMDAMARLQGEGWVHTASATRAG